MNGFYMPGDLWVAIIASMNAGNAEIVVENINAAHKRFLKANGVDVAEQNNDAEGADND